METAYSLYNKIVFLKKGQKNMKKMYDSDCLLCC